MDANYATTKKEKNVGEVHVLIGQGLYSDAYGKTKNVTSLLSKH